MNKNKNTLFTFIYLIRSYLPQYQLFYSTYHLFKHFSLIILTHNIKGFETNNITISRIIYRLSFFNNKSSFARYSNIYLPISITIFIILISFILFLALLLRHINKYSNKLSDITKASRIVINAISVFFTLLSFISQHLVEFLFLGVLNICKSKMYLSSIITTTEQYIIFGINIASIIILTLIVYLFNIISSSKYISLRNVNISFIGNKLVLIELISNTSLGIVTIIIINNIKAHYIVNLCLLPLLLLLYFIFYRKGFEYYSIQTYSNTIRLFIFNLCLISSLLEIIQYNFVNRPITQLYSLNKTILELFNSALLTYFTIIQSKNHHLAKCFLNVFNERQGIPIDQILTYQQNLRQLSTNQSQLDELCLLFNKHREVCRYSQCQCANIIINKWEKSFSSLDQTAIHSYNFNELLNTDLLIIEEQVILRSIYYLTKEKNTQKEIEQLILNHVDFVILLKHEKILGLYLIYQYMNQTKIQLSLRTSYYLFEYRHILLNQVIDFKLEGMKKININYYNEQVKRLKNVVNINKFYSYCCLIQEIKLMITQSIDSIKKILLMRSTLANQRTNSLSIISSSCDDFIAICKSFKTSNESILATINSFNKKIPHYEFSYIVINYYIITQKSIPKVIRYTFPSVASFQCLCTCDHIGNSFEQYRMCHPMILFLDNNDNFIVKYCTRKHCEVMKYSFNELLNSNLSLFMPEIFYEPHIPLLKHYALHANFKVKKDTFIFDREKHLARVDIHALPLPSIDFNIGLAVSMNFLDINTQSSLEYTLFLDEKYNFISCDNQFEKDFFFNVRMLQCLKLNFCKFFCANEDKLNMLSQQHLKKNINSSHHQKTGEESKLNTILQMVQLKTLLTQKNIIYHQRNHQVMYKEYLPKELFIRNIAYLNKIIAENGLDYEWYTRSRYLKDRLLIKGASSNFYMKYRFSTFAHINYVIVVLEDKLVTKDYRDSLATIKDSYYQISNSPRKSLMVVSTPLSRKKKEIIILTKMHHHHRRSKNSNEGSLKTNNQIVLNSKNSQMNTLKTQSNNNTSYTQTSSLELFNQSGNISLMNKNMFNKAFNKKNNAENKTITFSKLLLNASYKKILQISNEILIVIMMVMSIFGFLFNRHKIYLSQKIGDINLYLVIIESDIFYSSLGVLECCQYASETNTTMLNQKRNQLSFRGRELLNHYLQLSSSLNLLSNENSVSVIYSMLFTNSSLYYVLLSNYQSVLKQSTLRDELYYYHYFLSRLSSFDSFQKCSMNNLFNSTIPFEPNFEEETVYYIFKNVISTLKKRIDELIVLNNGILNAYQAKSKQAILLYNIVLYIIASLLTINCLVLFYRDQKYSQFLLSTIYTKSPYDDIVDDKLQSFLIALNIFNQEKCEQYEEKRDASDKFIQENDKKINEDFQRIQLTNNSSNTKFNLQLAKTDHIDVLKYSNALTIPKVFKSAFLFSTIFTFIFLGVELVYILENNRIGNNLIFENYISLMIIDNISTICQLIFYMKISIISNDTFLVTIPQERYQDIYYSNYYNITIDINDYTIFKTLGDSYYAYLYYQSIIIKQNLEMNNIRSRHSPLLPNTFDILNRVNKKDELCVVASVDFLIYFPLNNNSVANSFENINSIFFKCKGYGRGITLKGLNSFVDYALYQLSQLYIDFASSIALNKRIPNVLLSDIFITIDDIVNDTLERIHNVFIKSIIKDMSNTYAYATQFGLILSMILFSICILLFVYLKYFVVKMINKNEKLLVYIKIVIETMMS